MRVWCTRFWPICLALLIACAQLVQVIAPCHQGLAQPDRVVWIEGVATPICSSRAGPDTRDPTTPHSPGHGHTQCCISMSCTAGAGDAPLVAMLPEVQPRAEPEVTGVEPVPDARADPHHLMVRAHAPRGPPVLG